MEETFLNNQVSVSHLILRAKCCFITPSLSEMKPSHARLNDSLKVYQHSLKALSSSRVKIWNYLTPISECLRVPQCLQPSFKKGATTAVSTTKDFLTQPKAYCDTYAGNSQMKMQSHTPLDAGCNFQCTVVSTTPKCLSPIKKINISWNLSLHMCCYFSQIWPTLLTYITYLTFGVATSVLALLAKVSQRGTYSSMKIFWW